MPSQQRDPQPSVAVTVDTLITEARQVERERTLLEIRRAVDAIKTSEPVKGSSWQTTERSPGDVKRDVLSAIDRAGERS